MKIAISCLILGLDVLGGLQLKISTIIRGLIKEGFEIELIQTKNSFIQSKNFYSCIDSKSVKSIIIPYTKNMRLPWNYIQLFTGGIAKKLSPDIELLDTYDPYLLKQKHVPILYSTNYFLDYAIAFLKLMEIRHAYFPLLKSLIEEKIIHMADGFNVNNSLQKNRLIKRYNIREDCITIAALGFNEQTLEKIKYDYRKDSNRKVILYSGRISRLKGMYELISVFKQVALVNPEWDLWLVGDGPDKKNIEQFVEKYDLRDRVKFTGWLSHEEVLRHIQNCDIFVFPSYIECLPNSLIEAMALNKAVIATNVGGIPGDLIDPEKTGLLIKPKDKKSLANALQRLIDNQNLRTALASQSKEKVKGFTQEQLIKKTIQAYEHVLGKG